MAIFEFPGTNFHELNLDWLINQMKNCLTNWEAVKGDWESLEAYVTDYFNNLDVSEEINTIISRMVQSGDFLELMSANIETAVSEWLFSHYEAGTLAIDKTLTIEAAAAPASAVGAIIAERIPPATPVYQSGNLFKGNYCFNMGFVGTQQSPTMNRNAGRITAVIDCLAEGIPYGETARPLTISMGTVAEGSRRNRAYCADTLDPATANVTAAKLRNGANQPFNDAAILQNVIPAKRFLLIYCNLANSTPVTPAMVPSYLRVFYADGNSLAPTAFTGGTFPKGTVTNAAVYAAPKFIRFVPTASSRLLIKTGGNGVYTIPNVETVKTYEQLAEGVYNSFIIVGYPYSVETAYDSTSNNSTYTETVAIQYLSVAETLAAIADGACVLGYCRIDRTSQTIVDFHMETECHWIMDDAREGLVNVRSYLRTPAGADVSTDMQYAIETATDNGAIAYLPAQTYNIQKTLYLPPKTTLQCEQGAVIQLYDMTEPYRVDTRTAEPPEAGTPEQYIVTAKRRLSYAGGENAIAADARTDANIRTYIHAMTAGTLFPSIWRRGQVDPDRQYRYPIVMAGVPGVYITATRAYNPGSNIVIKNLTIRGRTYGVSMAPNVFTQTVRPTTSTVFTKGNDWTDKLEMDGLLVQGNKIVVENLRTMSINFEPWLFNQTVDSWATPAGGGGTNHAPAWALAVREASNVTINGLYASESGYEGLGIESTDYLVATNVHSISACRCAVQFHAACTNCWMDTFYAVAKDGMNDNEETHGNVYAYNANSMVPSSTTGGITQHCNPGFHSENIFISNGVTKVMQEVTGLSGGAVLTGVTFMERYLYVQGSAAESTAVYLFNNCTSMQYVCYYETKAAKVYAISFNGCVQRGDTTTDIARYNNAIAGTILGQGKTDVTFIP